jgi:hypothetical protein
VPDILYSSRISTANLQQLSKDLFAQTTDARLLAEQLPSRLVSAEERQGLLCFAWYEPEIPLADFTSGRIFHQDAELRWERSGDRCQVVYLGDEQYSGILDDYKCKAEDFVASQYHCQATNYYLFGQYLNVEKLKQPVPTGGTDTRQSFPYAEARVSNLMYYPLVDEPEGEKKKVRIMAKEYQDKSTGKLVIYRFQSLQAATIQYKEQL